MIKTGNTEEKLSLKAKESNLYKDSRGTKGKKEEDCYRGNYCTGAEIPKETYEETYSERRTWEEGPRKSEADRLPGRVCLFSRF